MYVFVDTASRFVKAYWVAASQGMYSGNLLEQKSKQSCLTRHKLLPLRDVEKSKPRMRRSAVIGRHPAPSIVRTLRPTSSNNNSFLCDVSQLYMQRYAIQNASCCNC